MIYYSILTEQDLINLRKLADQQKNQRALKSKNRKLKQTHDIKFAESLSPITTRLDEVKESTRKIGDTKTENNTPQQAIENTPTTHQPRENTPTTHQPIENNDGSIYDVELENTLINMKNNTGFFKTKHDRQRGWMINNQPIKILRDTEVEIGGNKYNKTQSLQKVFIETSNIPLKKLNNEEREIYKKNFKRSLS